VAEPKAPSRGITAAYASFNFATTLLSLAVVSWIFYYYSPPTELGRAVLLSGSAIAVVRVAERSLGALLEPLIGYLSDRTDSRFGRRMPWILLGTPVLVTAFLALWFPRQGLPTNDPRVVLQFAVTLILFWTAYTAVVSPYLALLPELGATDEGRVRLATALAVSEVLGNISLSVGGGQLLGATALFATLWVDNGYQLAAVVFAAIAVLFSLFFVAVVREPPREAKHAVRFSLRQATVESLRNPEFLPYAGAVGGYRMATATAVAGIPYLGTELMGLDEEHAALLLAVIIVFALIAIPFVERLANRRGKAAVFRWGGVGFLITLPMMGLIGLIPGVPPLYLGVLLFVLSGFPVATMLVLPRALLADVIDVDEARTGYRREAMYNGMSGVVEKAGEAASAVSIGVLFDTLGNGGSRVLGLRLVGVAAAIGVLLGLWLFRRYSLAR